MQFGRGLAWIVGGAVIGVAALVYFGLDGTEREEAPPEVLGTRGSESVDPSSSAGAGTRESRLAGARAARPGAGSSGTRAGERTPDRLASQTDRAALDAFVRAVRAELDVAPRDDRAAPETPGERGDEGHQKRGGVSDPTLEGGLVESPIVMACADTPWVCDDSYLTSISPPGAIPVVSNGIEAVLLPVAGHSDLVLVRTADGLIMIRTENITNAGQLNAFVQRLVARR